jgi:tetratricopeptide (TPR) repeat protein
MDEQEYQAAADSFTSYLSKCGKAIERDSAVINRAYCWFHIRRFSDAEKDFTEALQNRPDTQIQFLRGQARLNQGHAQAAIEDFTSVLNDEPDRLQVLIHRGKAYQAAERHEDAFTDFAAYLDAQPEDPDAHFFKSETLLALKKPREALAELVLARDYGSAKADETLRMLAGKI